jgi:hypothetical protein
LNIFITAISEYETMFKNIFIFIFGVLVTVERGRTAITPLDAIDDAQAALNQLREAVSRGLTNAFGIYTNASQVIDSTIITTRANGSEVITTKSDEYVSQYEAIVQSAEQAGADISVCVDHFENLIKNLGPENVEGLIGCVEQLIDAPITDIYSASTALATYHLKFIYDHEKQIVVCGKSDTTCLNNVISSIGRTISQVTSRIEYTARADITRLQLYVSKLTSCGDQYVSINEGKGKSLITSFQDCVDSYSYMDNHN